MSAGCVADMVDSQWYDCSPHQHSYHISSGQYCFVVTFTRCTIFSTWQLTAFVSVKLITNDSLISENCSSLIKYTIKYIIRIQRDECANY